MHSSIGCCQFSYGRSISRSGSHKFRGVFCRVVHVVSDVSKECDAVIFRG